jgi:SPOR domain
MADGNFRSYRRDAPARAADGSSRGNTSDPLAELARLIGQSDPHGAQARQQAREQIRQYVREQGREQGRDLKQPLAFDDAANESQADLPAGLGELFDRGGADDHALSYSGQAQWSVASNTPSTASPPSTPSWPQDHKHEDETPPAPPAAPYLRPPSGLAAASEDQHWSVPAEDAERRIEPQLSAPLEQPPSYLMPGRDGQLSMTDPDAYTQHGYDEEAAPMARRNGIVAILAVVGLLMLGTAGGLAYRAMFGHSMLPSLPPIIKPGNGPIKIVPSHEAQNSASGSTEANGQGTGEQVVSRQEQPVELPPANPTPRVVTTIPVVPNGDSDASGSSQETPPPEGAAPGVPPAGGGAAASPAPAFGGFPNSAASVPPGTKEVRTVTIRPGELGNDNAAPAAAAPMPTPAPRREARPVRPHEPAMRPRRNVTRETASAGPLSIVPSGEREAEREPSPPPHARARAVAPIALQSAPARAEPSRGGYAVQVSSQRSDAEARAAFRTLQARFPRQLGGRQVMIRRANLGSRGIYYRAMIGPFASAAEAAGVCSGLKHAGGSCVIQRD